VDLLEFILVGIYSSSWMYSLMFFIKSIKFLVVIASKILSPLLPPPPLFLELPLYVFGMFHSVPQILQTLSS
jgi:hypothetical protein